MNIYRISLIVFLYVLTSCAQSKNEVEWLKVNTSELQTETGYDFSSIKKAIGNKRIVALGESTHGSGSYYTLKSELVKYLHDEMGFEVLAMESGLGDAYLAYNNIDTLSSKELRDLSVFGNFRAKEASPLFNYIKSQNTSKTPLNYIGYDTQASSEYLFSLLKRILKDYNKELSDSLSTRMRSYQRAYGYGRNHDSVNYQKHRDIFVNTSNNVKRYLEENKDAIIAKHQLGETTYQVIIRSLSMFSASYNLSYSERWNGYALRDSLMAENLEWLITEVYPKKKFIVWAHNSHVEKGNMEGSNIKWMGHYLKERHLKDYYTIGLFAYSGETYQFWTEKIIPIENIDSTFIEHRVMTSEKNMAFLDLSTATKKPVNTWVYDSINGYEVENMGVVSFIPTKRFDGVIVMKESKAPTYNED